MRVLEPIHAATLHPVALVRARQLRSLTQLELADAAGISRQQVNNLERGVSGAPTAGTVHSLAQALRVPALYLATEPGPVPPADSLHFRGKMRRPPKLVEELQVRGEHFQRLTKRLERSAKPPEMLVPEHCGGDAEAIERAAEMCRVDWGLRTDNPILSVTRLLENMGVGVGLFRLDSDFVEAFSWWNGRPLVLCKRSGSATRRRFSLAHELGHLVMHRRVAPGDRDIETEAHRFAAAFLMPAAAFSREFPRASRLDWDKLLEMKGRWGVSVAALLHRAHELGILKPSSYRSAYVRISQLGWRKQEPNEPVAERPEMVRTIVGALRSRGTNEHSLAVDLGFDVELLEDTAGVDLREQLDPSSMAGRAAVIDLIERLSAVRGPR